MAYQALYRKYRPSNFDEVVGQTHIIQTLKNAIVQNRIAHAYLFCGPRGTEKLSVFEDGLNRIIEGVAVLLVTTCAIPVLVMLSFTWILKGIMGLKIPSITLQSVPRVSER